MNAKKMNEEKKVFYWPDTGPVEATVVNGKIKSAVLITPESDEMADTWESSNG